MNTLKITGWLVGTFAVATAWNGPASAQCPGGQQQVTETFTDAFGPEIGDWQNETLSVPKFTLPPNSTLIRAELTLCGQVDGMAEFQNNDDDVCTLTYQVGADIMATPDDPASPVDDFNINNITASGGPITLQPGQNGSDTFDSGIQCAPNSPQIFTGGPDLAWFISQPGDDTVLLNHSGQTSSQHFGCGVLDFSTTIFSEVFLTVTYVYCITPGGGGDRGCACNGPAPHYRRPGSMLLFPEFDNRHGDVTVLTVTNTDCGVSSPDVEIEYIYINKDDCEEFNRTETLTACDTLTLLTNFHNPQQEQGYVFVFAKDEDDNPIVWNHLIGNLLVISGLESFDYSVNPVAFRGIGNRQGIVQPDGSPTDLDGDGILDLDNAEYDPAPDTIMVPRFLGQDEPTKKGGALIQSQLILIALSGGAAFSETRIDCLLYNDNEESFSFDHTFYCWDKPYLRDITFAFSNNFLKTTDHDPDEILGAPSRESGWLCCDGGVASSLQESIEDPAFYMVLVERVGSFGVADLPFECGTQLNGALLPRDLLGDGDPTPVNGDNQ